MNYVFFLAYKLIPTKIDHLFLQGFKWLDHYFVETSQIFGARSAVPNYDGFSKDFNLIVEILSKIDPYFLERQLDDNIVITRFLEENKQFVDLYIELANYIGLPLAPFDNPEKAFLFQTVGTVLGVTFDTAKMTWTLSAEKRHRYMATIQTLLRSVHVTKKDMQVVNGMLNTLTLICKPLKFLRAPIVSDLVKSYKAEPIVLSTDCINAMHKWLFILDSLEHGFPIPKFFDFPPATCVVFVTDAAGGAALKKNPTLEIGVGCCGYVTPYSEDLEYVAQCIWPHPFISMMKDCSQKSFGNKTTLLECIGTLIPVYHNFKFLSGKHVLFLIDNVAVMWSYHNGRSRLDPYVTVIVTALHYVLMYLSCAVYVNHLPRVSTMSALYADTLSRKDSKGIELFSTLKQMKSEIETSWPPCLLEWMRSPTLDWNLGEKFLADCLSYGNLFWRMFVYTSSYFGEINIGTY